MASLSGCNGPLGPNATRSDGREPFIVLGRPAGSIDPTPWATAARIVTLPHQVAGCSGDAEPGYSENEIDVMAPIQRR